MEVEEEVFGLDTSADDAVRLMYQFIKTDWIKLEGALYSGKWFDYRFLNPVQATYLYHHEMIKAYRRAFAMNIDSSRAPYIKFLRSHAEGDMFKIDTSSKDREAACKQRISGVWRGRQMADAMGMPYDIYLERAFHWTLRFWNQSHLPRPQQLYSDLVTDRAAIDWDERQADRIYYSTLPQYRNQAYAAAVNSLGDETGLKAQNAHHEYLFGQIAARGNRADLLARFAFEEELLPPDKIKHRVGEEVFQSVLDHAENHPVARHYN